MRRYATEGMQALEQLRGELDRLFGGVLQNPIVGRFVPERSFPALNVWEREQELVAEAEVPGLRHEDLELSVVGNQLTIKGRRPEQSGEQVAYHRRERGTGEFIRTLQLPVEIDSSQVTATLRDGVLTITLGKAAAARPRKIQVNAG